MQSKIINGVAIASQINQETFEKISAYRNQDLKPCLAAVSTGTNDESRQFINMLSKTAKAIGIRVEDISLPEKVRLEDIVGVISSLNIDNEIDAIVLSKPGPSHLEKDMLDQYILEDKDIEGLHPNNYTGSMFKSCHQDIKLPCVVRSILQVLDSICQSMCGLTAVIVNSSNLIGKPLSCQLIHRGATVVICHEQTKRLVDKIKDADILISATGIPSLIKGDWIKRGTTVIDAGISYDVNNKISGDIEFSSSLSKADWITPVPGGIGPICISMMLKSVTNLWVNKIIKEYGNGNVSN